MNKFSFLSLVLIIVFISCKDSKKRINKLEIAKQYYKTLDNSNVSLIPTLFTDSLLTKESQYKQTFTIPEYIQWVKWDSVFAPKYEILKIKQENEIIKVMISKIDKRIFFLHEKPIITNQIIRFNSNKITSIETTDYIDFNDSIIFIKNRSELLTWINKNHPELNGFIYDQTKKGGLKYLKAIELFEKRK